MRAVQWLSRHRFFVLLVVLIVILPLLLPASWIEELKQAILKVGYIPGLVLLGLVLILATVIAPLNTLSLVPFASVTFGWEITALVCVISWTIGAVIAFLIARRFGKTALRFSEFFREAENYGNRIPHDLGFLSLVFLRMLIPVDILSYAIGLFTNISLFRYTLATLIGVTPFSIVWSYGGEAALTKEYLSLFAMGGVAVLIILIARHFYKQEKN